MITHRLSGFCCICQYIKYNVWIGIEHADIYAHMYTHIYLNTHTPLHTHTRAHTYIPAAHSVSLIPVLSFVVGSGSAFYVQSSHEGFQGSMQYLSAGIILAVVLGDITPVINEKSQTLTSALGMAFGYVVETYRERGCMDLYCMCRVYVLCVCVICMYDCMIVCSYVCVCVCVCGCMGVFINPMTCVILPLHLLAIRRKARKESSANANTDTNAQYKSLIKYNYSIKHEYSIKYESSIRTVYTPMH